MNTLPLAPCAACGEAVITAKVIDVGYGPRWLDLCWPHARAMTPPHPNGPTTVEEILNLLREVAKEVAAEMGLNVPLHTWTNNEGWTMNPPADPQCFHLTLHGTSGPIMHGWWGREMTARSKFSTWVGSWGRPGTRIPLVDEQEGLELTSWSDGS